jgi:hypothetical protein
MYVYIYICLHLTRMSLLTLNVLPNYHLPLFMHVITPVLNTQAAGPTQINLSHWLSARYTWCAVESGWGLAGHCAVRLTFVRSCRTLRSAPDLCPMTQQPLNLRPVHVGSCRPPDRQPTTTTAHHTTRCNLQSYAPDDGQIFVRNMLSWSWRSINSIICCMYLVLILSHGLCSENVARFTSKDALPCCGGIVYLVDPSQGTCERSLACRVRVNGLLPAG